jgi:carboxyl-terminal processing protease
MVTHWICSAVFTLLPLARVALTADPPQDAEDLTVPKEKFEDAARNFQEVKEDLLHNYYRDDITEADLYRAAVEGMLTRVDPPLRAYNQLLSPTDYGELQISMQGQVMGIGIQLKLDGPNGLVDVLGVIPSSPAEKAELRQGDQIVAIDGRPVKGWTLRDVVDAIRGKEGDSVRLDVLRDARITTKSVRRERVTFEPLSHQRFPGDVEVLSIHSFNERTPDALRKALGEIAQSGAKSLVIDLRDNQGGLLEQALETAKLLLPKGTVVTKLVHRGKRVDTIAVDKDPTFKPLPTVVLIGDHTMSSAELIAAALRQGLHAPLIGSKTHGKWSVQTIKELPNHYVAKYTVAVFQTPDGQSYEGTGMPPDVEVTMDATVLDRVEHIQDATAHLAADTQLRAAINLLRMRP